MSRAKKSSGKDKDESTINIDVEDFIRTRDSVVTGLTTLQDIIRSISSAYIKHTNAILGEHGSASDVAAALEKLAENPLMRKYADDAPEPPVAPAPKASSEAPADGKKERKKRQHDPDAPKRPLTPFFLYMQTARPIIANDLGPDVPKGAVSTEGTTRWGNMDVEDKQLWTGAYKENLRLYNARMHYYKLGNKDAKDMSDADAAQYAEEHNIGIDGAADAQLAGEAAAVQEDEDAEGEPEKEATPPPVKTPKAKQPRKGKAAKSAAVVEEAASDPAPVPTPASIVPAKATETPKSPAQKRKRPTKKSLAEEAKAAEEKEEASTETPAKSASKQPRKKKVKSDN